MKLRAMAIGPHKTDRSKPRSQTKCVPQQWAGRALQNSHTNNPRAGSYHPHTRKNNIDSETKRRQWLKYKDRTSIKMKKKNTMKTHQTVKIILQLVSQLVSQLFVSSSSSYFCYCSFSCCRILRTQIFNNYKCVLGTAKQKEL